MILPQNGIFVNKRFNCAIILFAKAGHGFYTKIDLGIIKYHFEVGAGKGSSI